VADDAGQAPKDIIGFLDFYFVKKAPFQIPEEGRELIVKWGPWIAVILLALTLPFVMFVLGFGTFLMPYGGYGYATGFGTAAAFLILHIVLVALSLPGLFARKMAGWRFMFYAQVASLIQSILYGAFISGIIGALIAFYILFQVRAKYS
jgi:hypothetical protein